MEDLGLYLIIAGSAWTGYCIRGWVNNSHREDLWVNARAIALRYPENGETQRALYEMAKYF